jgi:hypothetical protein
MNDLFCENINLFKQKLLNDEKIRIQQIIDYIEKYSLNTKNIKNDYNDLINNYKNIFKNDEKIEKNELLQNTEKYLKEQINILILNKKNNFLIVELEKEIEQIKKLKEKLL